MVKQKSRVGQCKTCPHFGRLYGKDLCRGCYKARERLLLALRNASIPPHLRRALVPRKGKKKSPTLASLKKKAWKLLSEVIRGEAKDWAGQAYCYTCGGIASQAGHAIGGRSGAVLFDEEIIRPQCVRCNIMLRGNYGEFALRLIREKVDDYAQALSMNPQRDALDWWEQKLSTSRQIKKWSRSDLHQKITEYKERLSRL